MEGALTAALATFADNERLARLILLEAVSLGPPYQAKRAEVAGRFASLIQAYLDEAAADGSIAPLDTRVATLAWLGAVNEIVTQWLHGTVVDLRATIAPLTRILLQSIGADPRPRCRRRARGYGVGRENPTRKSPARMARMIASRSRIACTSIQARPKWGGRWASSVAIFTTGIAAVS